MARQFWVLKNMRMLHARPCWPTDWISCFLIPARGLACIFYQFLCIEIGQNVHFVLQWLFPIYPSFAASTVNLAVSLISYPTVPLISSWSTNIRPALVLSISWCIQIKSGIPVFSNCTGWGLRSLGKLAAWPWELAKRGRFCENPGIDLSLWFSRNW